MIENKFAVKNWLLACFIVLLVFRVACERPQEAEQPEIVLAKIGNKNISLNEFKRRSEYTIRPVYCRGDNYVHKKIVLNSLIAEKLLALEADSVNELTRKQEFQDYLRGRKEQAMRQWHFYQEAFRKVKPDTNEIKKIYQVAGREYDISYFNVKHDSAAEAVKKALQNNPLHFEDIYSVLTGSTDLLPRRQIRWEKNDHVQIKELLFSNQVKVDQIFGPLQLENGLFTFIKINGWTNELALSDVQQRDRWKSVSDQLREQKALKTYEALVKQLMRGKRLEFNPAIFKKLVNIVGVEYYKTDRDKSEAFNQRFWDKEDEKLVLENLPDNIEDIRHEPLLKIDGKTWTVKNCEDAMRVHPLVFRKKRMPKNEFAEEFKLAIADMIRDQYITGDAYQKGYDKVKSVQRNYRMWKDNMLALYQKQRFLKSLDVAGADQFEIVENHLTPYVQKLYQKYNDRIEINTDEFEKVKITNIDMFVIQRNMPFPVIVPGFPQLTTHNKLDYGRKMRSM